MNSCSLTEGDTKLLKITVLTESWFKFLSFSPINLWREITIILFLNWLQWPYQVSAVKYNVEKQEQAIDQNLIHFPRIIRKIKDRQSFKLIFCTVYRSCNELLNNGSVLEESERLNIARNRLYWNGLQGGSQLEHRQRKEWAV